MVKKVLLQFLLLLFSGIISAQYPLPHAATVNIDIVKDVAPVPIYLIGKNHFNFISGKDIDSISVLCPDDNEANEADVYSIERRGEYYFVIEALLFNNQKGRFICVPELDLVFYLKNKQPRKIRFNCLLYPPVKIEFLDSLNRRLDISAGAVKYAGKLVCDAVWDLPSNVSNPRRVRGHFQILLSAADGNTIQDMEGWYDYGDRTKFFDLSTLKKYKTISASINKGNLNSYAFRDLQSQVDISRYPVCNPELSDYDPPVIKFILNE